MRLKRIKLFGFKTFADRSELDVDGDLIAIVGPNGCGKSNLVDAILWGLGEGNARHLRAGTNLDVIFSGSSRRKPLGYAEVSLIFDNADGALPITTSEVAITRRLNRSGESEYSINRQTCRLRDILDLLADSGLGRAGYAIVGQKEIDQALAASPEDRRAWVDEAAGVQRYRSRKIESLRRLQSAHSHLERVTDIIAEIETQRGPLEKEAETARRYKSALASLREVESGLLVVEVAAAVKEVEALEEKIQSAMRKVHEESAHADRLEREGRALGERISEIEREMDRVRADQQLALTSSERATAALNLSTQKLQSLDVLESNLVEEAEAAKHRIAELVAEIEGLRAEASIEEQNLERVRAQCAGAGKEADQLRAAVAESEKALAKAREQHQRRLRAEAEERHRKERISEIKRELAGAKGSQEPVEEGVREARTSFEQSSDRVAQLESELTSILEAESHLKSLDESDSQKTRGILAELAALRGRERGIEATIETHEGLNQGARAVLDAVDQGLLSNSYVPVGEAIETKKLHAIAIETALGASVNDLIVHDEEDAKEAIELLRTRRLGRATFQPIPLMKPAESRRELQQVLQQKGVVGSASDLVTCSSEYRPVIDSLLARVVIVDNLDTALRIATSSGWHRLVTLDGEVVHHSGAVTGGQSSKHQYGLVQRKAELSEMRRNISDLEAEIEVLERGAAARSNELEKLGVAVKASRAQIQEAQGALKEARDWLANLEEELAGMLKAQTRLTHELEQLQAKEHEPGEAVDLEEVERDRDSLLRQLASRSADAEGAEQRLRDAEARVQQAKTRLEQAERRLKLAEDAEHARGRKADHLGPERERLRKEIEKAKEDQNLAKHAKEAAEESLNALRLKKQSQLEKSLEVAARAKECRANAQALGDASHQAELARARADAKRGASLQRLMEEYGLNEEDALVQAPTVELPQEAPQFVGRLRRELKAMGDVNLGAIEAFDRLTERFDQLTTQRHDVLEGIAHVEESIKELDKLTRDKFLNTFAALQEAFSETFQKLFDGGQGSISLTRDDDILDSGIEIDVTLPGKKRQRLELLSGGERSLCATAFLFSLLKVKPSPLVVLDEVDAPLDGRNVERFVSLLQEFKEITQFVVITHNPVTIEAAPVWLGVTMQEPGVSTLVPAKVAARGVVDEVLAPESTRSIKSTSPAHA